MGYTGEAYKRLLQRLLPPGKAWTRAPGAALTEVLTGAAQVLARLDTQIEKIVTERDTRTTIDLLREHEIDLGLPDECTEVGATIEERRKAAHAKLIALGALSPAYYIGLAEALGYTVTIDEFTPFWCGVGACGDPCGEQENIFFWRVNIETTEVSVFFTAGSSQCGDPLQTALQGNEVVCLLRRLKPGHTQLIFQLVGPAFDKGYDSGFDSLRSDSGDYLDGAYSQAFSLAYDVNHGGAFDKDAFDNAFDRPQ
jgi:uncharacterized protein YmfQ (DUF2313 family)